MINVNPFEELASLIREVREKQDQLEAKLSHIRPSDDTQELVTRHEKAEQLKVSLPTLRNWEVQGLISPVRIGRRVYFRKATDHPKSHASHTQTF